MQQFIKECIHYSPLAVIPPVIIGARKFRQLSPELKVVFYYLILAALTELLVVVLAKMRKNNLPFLHLYTLAEFGLIARFYHLTLKDFVPPKLVPACSAGFLGLSVVNSLFIQTIYTYNSNSRSLEALLIIAGALLLFYRIISEMRITRLEQAPVFWINTGFLVYFSSSVFLFVMSNFILPLNKTLNIYIWGVHAFLNVLLYLLISIGLWKHNNN